MPKYTCIGRWMPKTLPRLRVTYISIVKLAEESTGLHRLILVECNQIDRIDSLHKRYPFIQFLGRGMG
jgi:hypothetical protein